MEDEKWVVDYLKKKEPEERNKIINWMRYTSDSKGDERYKKLCKLFKVKDDL